METCNICCETLKQSAIVTCPQELCKFSCCKICIKTYILQGDTHARCMSCKHNFEDEYIISINKTLYKEYTKFKKNLLYENEKKLIVSTQEDAKKVLLCEEEDKKISECLKIIKFKKQEIIIAKYNKIKIMEKNDDKVYNFKCYITSCNGYICDYKCNICNVLICDKCLCIQEESHECKEEDIKTTELIHKETRPCPKCKTRIYKIDGCDQMWCTHCKTAFSWKTSQIYLKNIHNPHYINYLKEQGLQARTRGDIRCGGIPDLINLWRNISIKKEKEPIENRQFIYKIRTIIVKYENFTRALYNELYKEEESTKDARILYILGKINEKKWQRKIDTINKKNERLKYHKQLMELVFNVGLDLLIELQQKIELIKEPQEIYKHALKMESDYKNIIVYTNNITIQKIKTFKQSQYLIKIQEYKNMNDYDDYGISIELCTPKSIT